jgi:5-methylcytosine-specific restriction enzyme subunit McrC
VADAKYAYVTPTAPPTSHLHQLLASCTGLGLPQGHLIYAASTSASRTGPVPHVVRRSGITVTAHTLDLAAAPRTLLADITTLAERITAPTPA